MKNVATLMAAAAVCLGGATPAVAAWDEYCPPNKLRGNVRSVTLYDVTVDHAGVPLREFKKSDEHVTRDGRTHTRVIYEADHPFQVEQKMFPTYVSQYDDKGRLVREVLRLDGREDHTVTQCSYDTAGRLSAMHQATRDYEMGRRDVTYSYGAGWRRQRWQSPVTVSVTTQYLDTQGRPVREERVRDIPRENFREEVESIYEYDDRVTRTCVSGGGTLRFCRQTRVDQHGNVVDSLTEEGGSTVTTYEYDSRGNWTTEKRVTTMPMGSRTTQLTYWSRREITYW